MKSADNLILITGCGRSGTKYISQLLTEMGLAIGHEEMGENGTAAWQLAVDAQKPISYRSLRRKDYPFQTILHQVRHPLAVIGSMRTALKESWDYIEQFIPIDKNDSLTLKAMKYWYYWNLEARKISAWTYRIEDLPNIFDQFVLKIGYPELVEKKEFLNRVDRTINTRKDKYKDLPEMTWQLLEAADGNLTLKIKKLAKEYGYKVL